MKPATLHFCLFAFFAMALSGCCVSHNVKIKNDTGAFVTVSTRDTGRGVAIPSGKQAALPLWEEPMVITAGNNVWFYPKIDYWQHPEARRRVFRFGLCQAGFGYFVTDVTLTPTGQISVGSTIYEPERKTQW